MLPCLDSTEISIIFIILIILYITYHQFLVGLVRSTNNAVEEINKTCKALKSRAFYYNINKIIFYIRCENVYKTYVNCFLKSKSQYFQGLRNICTTATVVWVHIDFDVKK